MMAIRRKFSLAVVKRVHATGEVVKALFQHFVQNKKLCQTKINTRVVRNAHIVKMYTVTRENL